MDEIEVLEKEFPGEVPWLSFSECFDDVDHELCKLINVEKDIARVLIFHFCTVDRLNEWLQRPIPALDGNNVREVLLKKNGNKIVRSLLMRMK